MKKLPLIFVLVALFSLSVAQGGLQLTFQSPGGRAVWTAPDFSESADEATNVDDSKYKFDGVLSDYMLVLDRATGNVAYKRTREITGEWKVMPADYKLVGYLKVRVEHEGNPIKSASVRVNDSAPRLIDEDSMGVVTFTNVKLGQVKVEVSFKSNKRDRLSRQVFEVEARREETVPTLVVSISQPVETHVAVDQPTEQKGEAKEAEQAKQTPPTEASKTSTPNFLQQLVVFILAAGALAGIMFFALKWVLKNEDQAKDALTKIGVQVNDPVQDVSDTPPPAPMKQDNSGPILLGPDATVSAGTGGPVIVAPTVGLSAVPKLVRSNGLSIEIHEGISLVGREDGLPFSFAGESTISRRHAEIERRGSTILVRDLSSTNGTFINGDRLSGEREVKVGDQIQFGAVQLRLE